LCLGADKANECSQTEPQIAAFWVYKRAQGVPYGQIQTPPRIVRKHQFMENLVSDAVKTISDVELG
jgi:hypothetical protein